MCDCSVRPAVDKCCFCRQPEKNAPQSLGSFKVPINETIICSIIVTIMSFFVRNLGLMDKIMRTLMTN